jgi:hypothetical protein
MGLDEFQCSAKVRDLSSAADKEPRRVLLIVPRSRGESPKAPPRVVEHVELYGGLQA